MKTCTKCGVQKPLEGFLYRKDTKKYRNDCRKCNSKGCRERYKKNREERLIKKKIYREENRDAVQASRRKYYIKNRSKVCKDNHAYARKRYKTDPAYRIMRLIRRAVNDKRRFKIKSDKTNNLIGCTWKYLKQWIESQMTDTMTFKTIHIDHMMPLASFDLTKPEEQRKACHYTNLQPMLPSENLSKGSKIIYDMNWNGQQWEINRSGIYELRDKNLK